MALYKILSIIAGILFSVNFVPYILSIRKGIGKPVLMTWITWAVLDTITFAGMAAKESLNGQIVGCTIGAWIVVAYAIKHGRPGWTKIDRFCLYSAVSGIALWIIFNDALVGLSISLILLFIASIPTFQSAWEDPSRENRLAWTIQFVSGIVVLLSIQEWDLANAGQPMVFMLIELIMMYLLYFHNPTKKSRVLARLLSLF